jgi:hypothetical protein
VVAHRHCRRHRGHRWRVPAPRRPGRRLLGVSIGCLVLLAFGGPSGRLSPEQVVGARRESGVDLVSLEQERSEAGRPERSRPTTRDQSVLGVGHGGSSSGRGSRSRARHCLARGGRAGPPGPWSPGSTFRRSRWTISPPDRYPKRPWRTCGPTSGSGQHHCLAHRQLRRDNVLVDDSGQVWLSCLAPAQFGATDRQLAMDVAELVSLAVLMGADRAAASAVDGLGAPAVREAGAYLQPLALTGRTLFGVRDYDRARSQTMSSGSARWGLRPGGSGPAGRHA